MVLTGNRHWLLENVLFAEKHVPTRQHVYVCLCNLGSSRNDIIKNSTDVLLLLRLRLLVQITSGYVFCYLCILQHIQENERCPVTLAPTLVDDLVRVYDEAGGT